MSNPGFPRLIDSFGRLHTSLRLSVTDACNIRCRYCMPAVVNGFLPQSRLLTFEQIETLVRLLVRVGVDKVRLTGGEPLMRPDLASFVARLRSIEGLRAIALTTNGMMLDSEMAKLKMAGLSQINISLDTLREEAFRAISRRDGLDRVLAGIDAAIGSGLPVRLNALLMRDINWDDAIPLVRFARDRGVMLRFIEFMPLDADKHWSRDQVVTGQELRSYLEKEFGELVPVDVLDSSQPARDYKFVDGPGGVGFIDPVSQPFCDSCNRLRLTADGKFRNCLFGREEWDAKEMLDRGASEGELYDLIQDCISRKHAAHGISTTNFEQPQRAMYQIGG
jgi:GTP 3',8-cyclase